MLYSLLSEDSIKPLFVMFPRLLHMNSNYAGKAHQIQQNGHIFPLLFMLTFFPPTTQALADWLFGYGCTWSFCFIPHTALHKTPKSSRRAVAVRIHSQSPTGTTSINCHCTCLPTRHPKPFG